MVQSHDTEAATEIRVNTSPRVRRTEWLLWVFLAYVAILATVRQLPQITRFGMIGLNLTILAVYGWLVSKEMSGPRRYFGIVRDWLPLLVTLLAYHEMGWFARPGPAHALEARWVIWDHTILRGGAKRIIESLGPVLPFLLEVAYSLDFILGPLAVATFYVYGRRNRVDQFLLLFVGSMLLCYAQHPFWPSEPPRTVFPADDLPAYTSIFRRWNLWLLGIGGIHTSVFPSTHVASAFSAATGMWLFLPEHRWISRSLGVTALLVAVATVYGRYHYLADVLAGMLMFGVAFSILRLIPRVHRKNLNPLRPIS